MTLPSLLVSSRTRPKNSTFFSFWKNEDTSYDILFARFIGNVAHFTPNRNESINCFTVTPRPSFNAHRQTNSPSPYNITMAYNKTLFSNTNNWCGPFCCLSRTEIEWCTCFMLNLVKHTYVLYKHLADHAQIAHFISFTVPQVKQQMFLYKFQTRQWNNWWLSAGFDTLIVLGWVWRTPGIVGWVGGSNESWNSSSSNQGPELWDNEEAG
jgi:hypothetical protein